MITEIIFALGLSTSPVTNSVVEPVATPEASIEEARRSYRKARISDSFNVEKARRSYRKARINDSFDVEEARRSYRKARI